MQRDDVIIGSLSAPRKNKALIINVYEGKEAGTIFAEAKWMPIPLAYQDGAPIHMQDQD